MRSFAPKKAEAEFDDLLGQLVDELAMTPPSQSAVALVPDPEPAAAHVASTGELAAEAAAAARATAPARADNTIVKIVGIIAGSLTVVAVAALIVFAGGSDDKVAEASAPVDDSAEIAKDSERAQAARESAEEAHRRALAAARAETEAEFARVEAARLSAQLAEQAEPKTSAKPRRPKPNKPKPKKPPGDDFDAL